jgi:membrane associated rhomboid family serine protease|tara:strand:+ start:191 stop:574 length:384 start_codon:yes stop_codon:yes gene_type:complete
MSNIINLLCGLVAGTIVFHSAIVAPTVFRTLGERDASVFLRTIFPKFFLFLTLINVVNVLLALIDDQFGVMVMAAISAVLMGIAYGIIPMTNRSRDEGLQQRFSQLHRVSVLLTVAVLSINVVAAFL